MSGFISYSFHTLNLAILIIALSSTVEMDSRCLNDYTIAREQSNLILADNYLIIILDN